MFYRLYNKLVLIDRQLSCIMIIILNKRALILMEIGTHVHEIIKILFLVLKDGSVQHPSIGLNQRDLI